LEAIKEFAENKSQKNPAKSTFLEFLISIYVNMEKWESVADTLQQLIDMHPELSSSGQYNLEPHVALFRKFTTLSPSAQSQLKRVYAQLAGPTGLPSANINRLQSLVNSPSDGGPGFLSSRDGGATGPHDVSDELPPTPGMFSFEKMTDNPHSQHVVSEEQKARAKERALQMSKELDDILMMLKQRKNQSPTSGLSLGSTSLKKNLSTEDDDDSSPGNLEDENQLRRDLQKLLLGNPDFSKNAMLGIDGKGKGQNDDDDDDDADKRAKKVSKKRLKKKNKGKQKQQSTQQTQQQQQHTQQTQQQQPQNPKKDEPLKNIEKTTPEDEDEDDENDDSQLETSGSSSSSAGKKTSSYSIGTLNKCNNTGCDKKEQALNQFKLCSRCKKACYCTIECQRKAWRKHKVQCQKKL